MMTLSIRTIMARAEIRARFLRALVYYAAFIALGLAVAAFGPTLPGLARQTGSTLGQISVIFFASSLGYMGGSLLASRVYDLRPGHPILAAALALMALLICGVPLFSLRALLVADFLLIGVVMGVLDIGGNTLIVWLFGREVAPFMNALHLAFGIGAFLSPLLVDRVIALTGGIQWAYWVIGLLLLPIAFWVTRLPSPLHADHHPATESQLSTGSFGVLVFLIAALMFLHVGAEGAFGGWIFSYTTALRLAPESLARLLNSTFWGSLMIGRLIAIPLAARWSPERMLLVGLCGMIASLGVMFVFPQIPLAAWIGAIGFGLFVAPMFATCLNFTERRMPITARVTGMIMIGANAGGMTLPWLIGQFFESAGPRVMVIFIGVSALTALAIYGLIRVYARRFPMRGAEAIS